MKYYGASYYPEQETAEELKQDVALMREIGFNAVRMGEFAWCRFEPQDGKFDFGWMDEAVEQLGAAGIVTIMCTPSACPPLWMSEKHPEILYRDNRGAVRPFGGRRHYCYNSPVYRDYCRRMASEMGKKYGAKPQILGWQIDNELAQEGTGRCHCDVCAEKFRQWLEQKYGAIADFNRRAGTIFWGQTYRSFTQIKPPLAAIEPGSQPLISMFCDSPTLRLDWERFCSDSLIGFQNAQAEVLRPLTTKPITTNATGAWTNGLNYYQGFEKLDIVAADCYPSLRTDEMYSFGGELSFHRGIKGKNFWLVETSSGGGQGVWARQGILQPFPGSLRQNALLAATLGADTVIYFQWKTFRYGAEQLEAAIIDIDGIPRRRFREFQQAARDLQVLDRLLEGTEIQNEVAVCYDYDCHWAIQIKPFHQGYHYFIHLRQFMAGLGQHGIGCDIIPCQGKRISSYKMIILPAAIILTEEFKAALKDYVRDGGVVVATYLTAIKGVDNTAPRASVPVGLTDLFGLRVGEGEPVLDGTHAQVRVQFGAADFQGSNRTWTESLEVQEAEVIGRYVDTFRQGEAVATRNQYGRGKAYYLGTDFDETMAFGVMAAIAGENSVAPAPFRFGYGVEVFRRRASASDLYLLFNYRQQETDVELLGTFRNLASEEILEGKITMPAKSHLVLAPRL
jgi:beta-galactosidase